MGARASCCATNVGQRALSRGRAAREFDQLHGTAIMQAEYAILPVRLSAGRIAEFYLEAPAALAARTFEVERLLARVAACLDDPPSQEESCATSAVERKRALLDLCEREEWCLSRVARRIGVSRPTLYRWLDEYGLGRPGGPRRAPVRA